MTRSSASGVRSERCTAKSKRSGNQCQHMVIGSGPCHMHGGKAPQVKRKRLERIALAQALAVDPRRDPGDVLLDVLHQADWLMRRAREEIRTDQLTADTMAKLLEATEAAGRWAKTTLDAGTDERQTRALEVQASAIAGVITRILDRLELTPQQRELVPVVVPDELDRMSPQSQEVGP